MNFKKAEQQWSKSRHGGWGTRGYDFQHLVSTLILFRQWSGLIGQSYLIPESLEDSVLEFEDKEVWVQIKSRKDGEFRKREAYKIIEKINHVAQKVDTGKQKIIKLITETPVKGVSEEHIDQLTYDNSIACMVCTNPEDQIIELIISKLNVAEMIAESLADDIYKLVVKTSIANAASTFIGRKKITSSQVENKINEKLKAIDPKAIDFVLAENLLASVNFYSPIKDDLFYKGVKAQPGHIAAGLVFCRPEKETICTSIKTKRSVLISGPSGAGKSALMWLCANELSGSIRWFQIANTASTDSVSSVIDFVKSRKPRRVAEIGIIIDDVRSYKSDMWDILSSELLSIPNTYLLGSIRNEDKSLIRNRAETKFISLSLSESLAQTIWEKLSKLKLTKHPHWREAFVNSNELMLEYIHILTQGTRLPEILENQVQERFLDNRYDEIKILRIASSVCRYGGEVDVKKLVSYLGGKKEEISKALSRLIDEHLISQKEPGVIGELHSLRTEEICKHTHDNLTSNFHDTLINSISVVTSQSLQRVIQSVYAFEGTTFQNHFLESLSQIIENDSTNMPTWISIFSGLGLATLEVQVSTFISLLQKHNVKPSNWSLASMFKDPSIDLNLPGISDSPDFMAVADAVEEFRNEEFSDLRTACFELLPGELVFPKGDDVIEMTHFLASLSPIGGQKSFNITNKLDYSELESANIKHIGNLLSVAYYLDVSLADGLVNHFGGEEELLQMFYEQIPWVSRPVLDSNGLHGRTVRSDLFFLGEEVQGDIHDMVCDVCELLINLSPKFDAAACDAVDPQGNAMKVGDLSLYSENIEPRNIYSKNMPRKNIHPKTRIAWNRAFRQILFVRSGHSQATKYSSEIGELVIRSEKILRVFSEKWLGTKQISNRDSLSDEGNSIVEEVGKLAYTKSMLPSLNYSSSYKDSMHDDSLGALLIGIIDRLMRSMRVVSDMSDITKIKRDAMFASDLASQALDQCKSEIWNWTLNPPITKLENMADRLKDISHIMHEIADTKILGNLQVLSKKARKAARNRKVKSAANYCRRVSHQRINSKLKLIKSRLKLRGWESNVHIISSGEKLSWPTEEVVIIVDITEPTDNNQSTFHDDAIREADSVLQNKWKYSIAPSYKGKVLCDFAVKSYSGLLVSDIEIEEKLKENNKLELYSSQTIKELEAGYDEAVKISTIIYTSEENNLRKEEAAILELASERFNEKLEVVRNKFNDEQLLEDVALTVIEEQNKKNKGENIEDPLCMMTFSSISGTETNHSVELAEKKLLIISSELNEIE